MWESGVKNYNHLQKILEKLCKLKKSCNHKRNINRINNEKLHYNCLQQLPTLRLNGPLGHWVFSPLGGLLCSHMKKKPPKKQASHWVLPTVFSPMGGPEYPHKKNKKQKKRASRFIYSPHFG